MALLNQRVYSIVIYLCTEHDVRYNWVDCFLTFYISDGFLTVSYACIYFLKILCLFV